MRIPLVLLTLLPTLAFAHGAGFMAVGSPERIHRELVAIFGENAAFSARATLTTKKPDGDYVEPLGYHLRDSVLRLERDAQNYPFLKPEHVALRKAKRIDLWNRLVTASTATVLYPRLKAYIVFPNTPTDKPLTIERSALGSATLDGRACEKERLVVDNGDDAVAITVWRATDMDGFPVRIENTHGDKTTILDLADVRRDPPPAADLFNVPAGYTRYESTPALLDAADAALPSTGQ